MHALTLVAVFAIGFAAYHIGHNRATNRRFEQLPSGKFSPNGVRARIRLIAADTLEPIKGAQFQTILIGPDGGDGGFHAYTSDEYGALVTDQYLWPGRYQIYIRPPNNSRFEITEYSEPQDYLVVRDDGSYSPAEFKVSVQSPAR